MAEKKKHKFAFGVRPKTVQIIKLFWVNSISLSRDRQKNSGSQKAQ
jgi:hypothetical protein